MTAFRFIARSLRFYWRTHLGVLLGAALACAILTGALAVGDSVRFTLQRLALARLGGIAQALASPDRFFRARLADELSDELKSAVAPVFLLRGSASIPDGRARANEVQVVGADDRFWELGSTANPLAGAGADEVVVNERLAGQLGLRAGDDLIVRVEPPSLISRDAPLSGRSDATIALRLRVRSVAAESGFGRFGLQANQVPPMSVFVPLDRLQRELKRPAQANTLLVATSEDANAALRKRWTLADAGLELRELSGQNELRSERVFLDPAAATAAFSVASNATGVLTYFADEIRLGDRSTPYSFVAARDWRGSALEIANDEIVINEWLAADLGAKRGDELTLRYRVIGARRGLREEEARFRVHSILPTAADSSWMPQFPGLAGQDNCRDWSPGIPIAADRIRPKDEDYWDTFRGTPKAFVTLEAGRRLWSNRFGDLTAIRFPAGTGVEPALMQRLDPASLGLFFAPVREQAMAASGQAMDFGQLFVGFSFFLIAAALLLTAMLFVFNLEQRSEQVGLMRAVGLRPGQILWLMLLEGSALALIATFLGIALGSAYARATLFGLSTVWRDAVGTPELVYHANASTLVAGTVASLLASVVAMWTALRGLAKRPPALLLAGGGGADASPGAGRAGWWVGAAGLAGAVLIVGLARGAKGEEAAGMFFGAGSLLLVAGLGFCRQVLAAPATKAGPPRSLAAIALRGPSRRRGRSLTTIGVLASGFFLVVAVNAFRQDALQDALDRGSGTGGFALFAQSASPVYDDLNGTGGRILFGLDGQALEQVSIVPMRVRDGDDASCLNLNRAQQPRILGVRAGELARRKAFTFAHGDWTLLDQRQADGAIPAIGDEQTVTWALGLKAGETLALTDDQGRPVTLRIVGTVARSILQGSLLISETDFIARFPSAQGYRRFLIDCPPERAGAAASALSHGLQDLGLEVVPSWRRLADFMAVENTYLGIFQALGGLGLLLGVAGLAVVVLRNVSERRGELALLQAVGFRKAALHRLVLIEHALLIFLGLLTGLTAAMVAILPALHSPGTHLPAGWLACTLLALALGGFAWTWLATAAALRGLLTRALRNE